MSARTRTGAIIGTVAQGLALCVAFLGTVIGLFFAPSALGQSIVELLPGAVTIPLIELLGHWAQRLLVIALVCGFLLAGAAAGALARSRGARDRDVLAAGAAPWLLAVVLPVAFASAQVPVAGVLADAALGAAAFALVLAYLAGSASPAGEPVDGPSRRRALLGLAAVAALVGAGGLVFAQSLRAVGARLAATPLAARRLRSRVTVAAADPAFESIPRLTPRLTPTAEHYTVDTALVDPRVDERRWKLEISGAVERPFSLTYDELLDLEAIEQLHTLECISNETGGDLVSTALWTGVPLADLLGRAGLQRSAADVVFRSVDGYTDSIPVAKAMDPRTIVAYLMDGLALPEEHGFPARMLIPDIYGMKNVKWLEAITVSVFDYQGYWMERGWSDLAVMNTHSRIDTAGDVRLDGDRVTIAGIANAGARGISKVEVTADGGRTWLPAELEPAAGPLTWVRWRVRWAPPGTGTYRVSVRATDGPGQTQTATARPPFPSGSTGLHTVELRVGR